MNPLRRLCLIALVATSVGLVAAPSTAQVQGTDYTYSSFINPRAPRVGEDYTFGVDVRNNTGRNIIIEARIDSVPNGDRINGASTQRIVVGPGATQTFRFSIYCGVEGGTVQYGISGQFTD